MQCCKSLQLQIIKLKKERISLSKQLSVLVLCLSTNIISQTCLWMCLINQFIFCSFSTDLIILPKLGWRIVPEELRNSSPSDMRVFELLCIQCRETHNSPRGWDKPHDWLTDWLTPCHQWCCPCRFVGQGFFNKSRHEGSLHTVAFCPPFPFFPWLRTRILWLIMQQPSGHECNKYEDKARKSMVKWKKRKQPVSSMASSSNWIGLMWSSRQVWQTLVSYIPLVEFLEHRRERAPI